MPDKENDLAPLSADEPVKKVSAATQRQARQVFLLAALFEGGLIFVALGLGWLCGFSPLTTFAWTANGFWLGVVGTIPPVIGLLVIDRFPIGPLANLKSVVDEMIVPMFRGVTIAQFAIIAALAGISEELLFRGLLQGGLEHYLAETTGAATAPWIALVVASAVFGMMHPITPLYAFLCFVMGIYLGGIWLLVDPRNLLAPIVIHGLYDFVALVYLIRNQPPQAPEDRGQAADDAGDD